MKVRLKPAFRSRLLATGVSLVAFGAMVSGFIQESQDLVPEQSVKLAGANDPLPPEVLVTQKPIPVAEPTPSPTGSPTVASRPSPATSVSPSAKPTKSPSPNISTPSPAGSQRPSSQPSSSALPLVNPSPNSIEGVAPATPALPVPQEVNESLPSSSGVYTCMSAGGNTREPTDSLGCPGRWGYVLTQI